MRDDHRSGAIAGHVAIEETEGVGDHACGEVVVHGHRIAVDGIGVERGVLAVVQRDLRELLAGRAVLVEVPASEERDPDRSRGRRKGQRPLQTSRRPKGVPSACTCLLYTSPSPRDKRQSRMPSSA